MWSRVDAAKVRRRQFDARHRLIFTFQQDNDALSGLAVSESLFTRFNLPWQTAGIVHSHL
jgi:hypothetical protein